MDERMMRLIEMLEKLGGIQTYTSDVEICYGLRFPNAITGLVPFTVAILFENKAGQQLFKCCELRGAEHNPENGGQSSNILMYKWLDINTAMAEIAPHLIMAHSNYLENQRIWQNKRQFAKIQPLFDALVKAGFKRSQDNVFKYVMPFSLMRGTEMVVKIKAKYRPESKSYDFISCSLYAPMINTKAGVIVRKAPICEWVTVHGAQAGVKIRAQQAYDAFKQNCVKHTAKKKTS